MEVSLKILILSLNFAKLDLQVFKVSIKNVLLSCKALKLSFFVLEAKLGVLQLCSCFEESGVCLYMGLLFKLKLVYPKLSRVLFNSEQLFKIPDLVVELLSLNLRLLRY